MHKVKGVVSKGKNQPVSVETILVPDPGPGEALVDVVMACPRCVMTTHGFGDLAKDPSIMRALVREAGGNLGVYAKPRKPGRVRAGDEVRIERP